MRLVDELNIFMMRMNMKTTHVHLSCMPPYYCSDTWFNEMTPVALQVWRYSFPTSSRLTLCGPTVSCVCSRPARRRWNSTETNASEWCLSQCSPLPILSLSGVDRHDCLLPSFSVLCELWVELVLSQITPHSVHPPQSGPSSRSLPSHLHRRYLLCNVQVFSSHNMSIPRKVFLGDICGDWLDHFSI